MRHAMEGRRLGTLVRMAIPICKAAQKRCPRTGPGHPFEYRDWQIAVLIFTALLKRRKSKSSQYQYLTQHAREVKKRLGLRFWPARSTYFERYRRAWQLFEAAIEIMGRRLCHTWVDARVVAVDKSLMHARGPKRHTRSGRRGRRRRGADDEAGWGYSAHHGWVYGYSFEVVVTAPTHGPWCRCWPRSRPRVRANTVLLGQKSLGFPLPRGMFWPTRGMTTTGTASRSNTTARTAPAAGLCVPRSDAPTIRHRMMMRTSRSGAVTAESLVRVGTHGSSSFVVPLGVV